MTLLRAMGVASACGLDVACSVLLGVLAGLLVDGHLRSAPWGLLIGLLVGLAAGFYTAYLIIAPIVRSLLAAVTACPMVAKEKHAAAPIGHL